MSTNTIDDSSHDYGSSSIPDELDKPGGPPPAESNQAHSTEEGGIGGLEQEDRSPLMDLPLEIGQRIVDHLDDTKDVHNLSMTGRAFAAVTSHRRNLDRAAHNALKKYDIAHLAGQEDQKSLFQLHGFVGACTPEELKAVVDAGKLNVNATTRQGSALHAALLQIGGNPPGSANKEALEKISILLKAGAVPDPEGEGESYLEFALRASPSSHSDVLPMLLKAGADPNRLSVHGTPLNGASSMGNKEAVRLLLDAGADPELGILDKAPLATVERKIEKEANPDQKANYIEIQTMLQKAIVDKRQSTSGV